MNEVSKHFKEHYKGEPDKICKFLSLIDGFFPICSKTVYQCNSNSSLFTYQGLCSMEELIDYTEEHKKRDEKAAQEWLTGNKHNPFTDAIELTAFQDVHSYCKVQIKSLEEKIKHLEEEIERLKND